MRPLLPVSFSSHSTRPSKDPKKRRCKRTRTSCLLVSPPADTPTDTHTHNARARTGFGVWISPLCVAFGFSSKSAVERVFVVALSMHTLVTSALIMLCWPAFLEPFSAAIAAISNVMLFLSLLIISSEHSHFCYRRGRLKWYVANVGFVVLVSGSMFLGPVLGLAGMTNAANTFAVLYLLEKYAEFHMKRSWNGWVLVLVLSLAAWQGSLYLSQNPQHLVCMLSSLPAA